MKPCWRVFLALVLLGNFAFVAAQNNARELAWPAITEQTKTYTLKTGEQLLQFLANHALKRRGNL